MAPVVDLDPDPGDGQLHDPFEGAPLPELTFKWQPTRCLRTARPALGVDNCEPDTILDEGDCEWESTVYTDDRSACLMALVTPLPWTGQGQLWVSELINPHQGHVAGVDLPSEAPWDPDARFFQVVVAVAPQAACEAAGPGWREGSDGVDVLAMRAEHSNNFPVSPDQHPTQHSQVVVRDGGQCSTPAVYFGVIDTFHNLDGVEASEPLIRGYLYQRAGEVLFPVGFSTHVDLAPE